MSTLHSRHLSKSSGDLRSRSGVSESETVDEASIGRPPVIPVSGHGQDAGDLYGFSVDPDDVPGPYVGFMVDHRFGEVWTRPELDTPDRRLMTIGVLAAQGQPQLVELQFQSDLDGDEMTEDPVRETVIHLAHYIGWSLSTGVNPAAERVIVRRHPTGPS
jgi:4-carboxymuconolactone decarboxylase